MSHRAALALLGLEDRPLERLAAYLDALARWSVHVNLTGAATVEDRVRVLVASVLPALPLARPGHLIDVGSGSGSPGLVFAAVRDDIEVTLLEPRLKRWAFLREAARAMCRPGVFVRQARHDTYVGPPAQTVTLRALRLPLGELTRLVEEDGRLLVFGDEPESVESFVAERGAGGPACRVYRRCST